MTKLTAHSGSDGLPENSMDFVSFFAHKKEIDAIELDVRLGGSRGLILSHDKPQNAQQCLTLEEVFQYCQQENSQVLINCDLKEANLELKVHRLAKKYQLWDQICFSGTVSAGYLTHWGEQIYMNIENVLPQFHSHPEMIDENMLLHAAEYLKGCSAKVVNLNYQWYTEKLQKKMTDLRLEVSLWTVNDLAAIERYKDEMVHNITSRMAWTYAEERKKVAL